MIPHHLRPLEELQFCLLFFKCTAGFIGCAECLGERQKDVQPSGGPRLQGVVDTVCGQAWLLLLNQKGSPGEKSLRSCEISCETFAS